jgi:hypothetical protein
VENAPPTTNSKLKQELSMNFQKQIQINLEALFDTLHCLLDRETIVRRQVDLAVEDSSNYDVKKNVTQ